MGRFEPFRLPPSRWEMLERPLHPRTITDTERRRVEGLVTLYSVCQRLGCRIPNVPDGLGRDITLPPFEEGAVVQEPRRPRGRPMLHPCRTDETMAKYIRNAHEIHKAAIAHRPGAIRRANRRWLEERLRAIATHLGVGKQKLMDEVQWELGRQDQNLRRIKFYKALIL